MYQQMALTSSGIAFAWSRFNAEEGVTDSQIVIQAHDQLAGASSTGEVKLRMLFLLHASRVSKLIIISYLRIVEMELNFYS